ncbi:MAG: hypothetical protein K2L72_01770, partial [Clostridia bacterium]|nr:hypothetical protein [Clostridia bacterium]
NATITDVKWYAPNGTQVVSGQNGITISADTTANTYSLTFAKPTVAQSGSYTMKYKLTPTTTAAANGLIQTEERSQTAILTIKPYQVYKPVFDQTVVYTYNGSEQTVKYDESRNAEADRSLYTITNTKATNAGTYYPTVTLKDGANYEWYVAPQDPDTGATLAKNAVFRYKWTINKVDFGTYGAASEANAIIRYYPEDNTAYVGQNLSAVGFASTSYAKYKNAAGEMVNVPGTFAWKNPGTRLTNGSLTNGERDITDTWAFAAVATFTPDDTTNFAVHERGKNPVIKQLYVNVRIIKPDGSIVNEKLPVDYGEDLSFVKNDPNVNTYEDAETLVFTYKINDTTKSIELPEDGGANGYELGVFTNSTAGGLTGEIDTGAAYIKNVQSDKQLYIGFTAKYVSYTIFHVRQFPNGTYASEADIKSATSEADYATMLVEKKTISASDEDKLAGATFSPLGKVESYKGFAFDNDKTAANVTIAGDGSTQLFI